MLLLRMTVRANFWEIKFSSFVVFEQLNIPKPLGPSALAASNPSAARCRASSQVAGRSLPPSLTNGSVRRSRPSSTCKEYRREANLGGPTTPGSSRSSHDHPLGWNEPKLATGFDHLPSPLVHESVVEEAQKHEVGQLVRPTSRPGDDVMGRRPVEQAIATGEPAAAISYPQRPPHRS